MPTKTYKSMEEAVAEMLQWWWYATGQEPAAAPGDVLRTVFESVGLVVEDITTRFDAALESAIPEAVFVAFGFNRRQARPATTTLRFSRTLPAPREILIPQGTRARTPTGVVFATTEDAYIPEGGMQADAEARAEMPGSAGNVPAGSISLLLDVIPGVEAVTNPVPATGGEDEESLEAQKRRFALWLAQIARGTKAAIAAAALEARVGDAYVDDVLVIDGMDSPTLPPGHVRVYVDAIPSLSPSLRAVVEANVEAVRAAGIRVQIAAAERRPVDVAFTLENTPADALPHALEAVRAYFRTLRIGQPVRTSELLVAIANSSPLVRGVRLQAPASDIGVSPYTRATLGNLAGGVA